MKVNPEYNKILAEALAKADAQKDFIPLSVIEDIKVDIYKSCCFNEGTQFARGLLTAIRIIDRHIGGKENE